MKSFVMSKEFVVGLAVGAFVLPYVINFVKLQVSARTGGTQAAATQ